jgi:hypothetical protein
MLKLTTTGDSKVHVVEDDGESRGVSAAICSPLQKFCFEMGNFKVSYSPTKPFGIQHIILCGLELVNHSEKK